MNYRLQSIVSALGLEIDTGSEKIIDYRSKSIFDKIKVEMSQYSIKEK